MGLDPLDAISQKQLVILKIKDGGGGQLENQKIATSALDRPVLKKNWHGDVS